MRLVELFDKPISDIEWEETVFGEEARFSIGENIYNVSFVPIPPDTFEDDRQIIPRGLMAMLDNDIFPIGIEFELLYGRHRVPSQEITGTGNEIKVFSTVTSIIQQWLWRTTDTQLVYLSAKEPSRTKLYRRMVNSFAKGKKVWELVNSDDGYTYWVVKL